MVVYTHKTQFTNERYCYASISSLIIKLYKSTSNSACSIPSTVVLVAALLSLCSRLQIRAVCALWTPEECRAGTEAPPDPCDTLQAQGQLTVQGGVCESLQEGRAGPAWAPVALRIPVAPAAFAVKNRNTVFLIFFDHFDLFDHFI